jgi:hypothetical protein
MQLKMRPSLTEKLVIQHYILISTQVKIKSYEAKTLKRIRIF